MWLTRDAGVLQLADLRGGFAFDLGFVEAAKHEVAIKLPSLGRKCCAFDEGGDFSAGGSDGDAVCQHDVAADGERGACVGECDGVGKGRAVGHERGGEQAAGVVQFGDGAVYAGGEAEVVRVDEESAHWEKSINALL